MIVSSTSRSGKSARLAQKDFDRKAVNTLPEKPAEETTPKEEAPAEEAPKEKAPKEEAPAPKEAAPAKTEEKAEA